MKSTKDPVFSDGDGVFAFPYGNTLSGKESHVLIDANGTGYYVATGVDIRVRRKHQTSPSQTGDGTMSSGDFAAAWLDHGLAPKTAGYEYVVVPATTPLEVAKVKNEIEAQKVYAVLQKNSAAHVITYLPKRLHGYVIFGAAAGLPGPVEAVDSKCLVMVGAGPERMRVSVVNPVLGLKRRGSRPSRPKTLLITVKGSWSQSTHRSARIRSTTEAATRLAVDTVDGVPMETVLTR